MIALQITDIKSFMNTLLKSNLFDHFLLQEATIMQAVTYTIDGTMNADFFEQQEAEGQDICDEKYIPFGTIRSTCFELIKGKRKPEYFKFVLQLSEKNQANTIAQSGSSFQTTDVNAMYLNLLYKNNTLTCTTGISYRLFSLDKTLEHEWDRLVMLFFKRNQIPFEQPL